MDALVAALEKYLAALKAIDKAGASEARIELHRLGYAIPQLWEYPWISEYKESWHWRKPFLATASGDYCVHVPTGKEIPNPKVIHQVEMAIEKAKGEAGRERKQSELRQPEEMIKRYGHNYERDKWLYENRTRKTLPQLETELERLAESRDWTPITQPSIRHAIERYARFFGLAAPEAKVGRPKKT